MSLHPGAVRTELQRYFLDDLKRITPILKIVYHLFFPIWWICTKSPVQGAQTTIHCAVDDSIVSLSGKYFSDCKVKRPTDAAQDVEAAERLWEISAKMVQL